ncbi:MAG: hypothetical protein HDR31_01685 [Mycoplasma sp.]|nr:hypothetical protein [Mycoplasma sp.]
MKNFFSKSIEKIKNWPKSQKIYASFWIITAILLVISIVLFVVWESSSTDTYTVVLNNEKLSYLTDNAVFQQNVIAGVTLTTVIFLAISIFATTISCYKNKKKRAENAN